MRIGVFTKLTVAMVGVAGVILIATLFMARWSFKSGFEEYVIELEQQRLEQLAATLASLYFRFNGDWERVLNTPPGQQLRGNPDQLPHHRPPPPHHERGHRPKKHHGGRRPPPPRHSPTRLLDVERNHVGGVVDLPTKGIIEVRITDGSTTVGYLQTQPTHRLMTRSERRFANQQLLESGVIAAGGILLAVCVALFVARRLVGPITALKQTVQQISGGNYQIRHQVTGQDEVADLARSINQLAHTLASHQTARKRLLADLSHELRTPVAILNAELEAVGAGLKPLDQKQLGSFQAEVDRLTRLISDLYDLAMADAGGLNYQFEKVDSASVLRDILNLAKYTLSGHEWHQSIDMRLSSYPIHADPQRLTQLFTNLLNNAVRHTNLPGKIQVRAELSLERQLAIYTFEDSPPGIKPSDAAQIFVPFEQVANKTHADGAGLGLAICRYIVQAHQGNITADTSALGGVRVTVELPVVT